MGLNNLLPSQLALTIGECIVGGVVEGVGLDVAGGEDPGVTMPDPDVMGE